MELPYCIKLLRGMGMAPSPKLGLKPKTGYCIFNKAEKVKLVLRSYATS
jgi:hypothetical protein